MNSEPLDMFDAEGERGWFRGADRTRFGILYREEKPRLVRFFQRKLGNKADADDLAQEALARFLRSAPAAALAPRGYLTRIAHNLVKDRARRNSTLLAERSVPLDEGLAKAALVDTHREVAARQEVLRWRSILQQLPADTLEIFVLNRVEGYSYREIGETMELPLWQVQKHMLAAIQHVSAHRNE